MGIGYIGFEVYNFVYLLGLILVYRAIRVHYKIFTKSAVAPNQKWWHDLPILISGLLLGTFLPFITGFMMVYLSGSLIHVFLKSPKIPNNENSILWRKTRQLAIIWFWTGIILSFTLLIIIFSFFSLGLLGRWLSLSYYYPISTTFGMLIAPIGFWGYNKIHQNHPNAEVLKVTLVKVKVVGVVMSFIISMGFIITISAQIPPTVPDDLSLYHSTRVITFNILNKNSNKFEPANYWENRKIHVANHLGTLDPDIFGVQEAYFEQLEYLNQTLNNRSYNWTGVGRDDGVIAGEFSAIFYDMEKYNLLDHGTFWLSDTPDIPSRFPQDHNRICSWVHLQFIDDHSEFFVFNTHYGFSTELQIKSSILINQRVVDMTADFPVIVMGDFNMMNVYPHYMFMEAFGVKPLNDAYRLMHRFVNPLEATSAPTFKIKTDIGFHIDHFFISEDIIPATVDIIKESYDGVRTYSDHYPVKMDCYIPRKNG